MELSPALTAYWQAFVAQNPAATNHFYESFYFGSQKSANGLAELVAQGIKTATSALLWEVEAEGKRLVQPGDLSIVTNFDGEPVCIVETTEVRLLPFNVVDAEFAYDYGEGERSLEWWQREMWDYYGEVCATLDKQPDPAMLLVCERFKVVYL